ncbi:transmembrane ascorbate-dependent reductase CYB561 isoform X1 [Patella vulgata]|uniref:transmembrane ascorbate-dependent reductase CYB561 isoform X1 n=2 Tax=Patella vulgata TaxID=6465 RepID=UPI0021801C68|nr:transmembrane ascorbate-dependent reductase CYB561 isoform X1 [Patella vulgata]
MAEHSGITPPISNNGIEDENQLKMEPLGKSPSSSDLKYLTWLVLLAQAFGLSAVVLVAVWMGHFQKGFSWQSDPNLEFNYHPLFMIIGMIFLYSDAILAYRVFRNDKKIYVKLLHAGMHVCALLFAAVGLKAVFDSHNLPDPPKANLSTLHSWVGLIAVVLYGLQWLGGFFCFLFPKAGMATRIMMMPHHQFWGMAIFGFAVAAALMGITEKAILSIKPVSYFGKPPEGLVANFLGLMILGLATTVIYILTRPEYKRPPSPDEEHLQLQEN